MTMTVEEREDFEGLQAEILELEKRNEEHARINRELIKGLPKTPYVEAIRLAAEIPLLWGRGDYSLGYSISQHILSLVNEHNPDWGFYVLPRQEIEKLIEKRDYMPGSMRFTPRPRPLKILSVWLKGMFR